MQKVLHPAYFPTSYCDAYPLRWTGFTLEQAMAAYWKVKSWNFSFSNYSGEVSGGGGSFNVNVNADKMSDLVCGTFSQGSGFGTGEVFDMYGSVDAGGITMDVECFDDIHFSYYSGLPQGSQMVEIIIGEQTIISYGSLSANSATVRITATSFF